MLFQCCSGGRRILPISADGRGPGQKRSRLLARPSFSTATGAVPALLSALGCSSHPHFTGAASSHLSIPPPVRKGGFFPRSCLAPTPGHGLRSLHHTANAPSSISARGKAHSWDRRGSNPIPRPCSSACVSTGCPRWVFLPQIPAPSSAGKAAASSSQKRAPACYLQTAAKRLRSWSKQTNPGE